MVTCFWSLLSIISIGASPYSAYNGLSTTWIQAVRSVQSMTIEMDRKKFTTAERLLNYLMIKSLSQLEKLPIFDFGYGQTGVGWGWEYISAIYPIQKHYTDRLNGLDKNVKENMQQEQSNETLYLLHYVLARMAGCKARSENTLFTVQDVDLLANRADGFSQTDLSPENQMMDNQDLASELADRGRLVFHQKYEIQNVIAWYEQLESDL